MRIRLVLFFRRLAHWAAGLVLIPLGLVTCCLFCGTGRPLPSALIPAQELPFTIPSSDTLSPVPYARQALLPLVLAVGAW